MSEVLASKAKKVESSSKQKIELEKNNDQDVRVTISDQTRKDDESAILSSKAEKGESSSKRKSDIEKCNESDAGNTKSNQKQKTEDRKAKHDVVVEMIEASNVNEVKNGVVDKGYVESAQEGVESDWNLGNTDVVERGKGEYMGNVGHEDTCGKCINDSLNGNEDKGTENVAVANESLMDLADMVNEGSVDECIHVADQAEMGLGDRY